MGFECSSLCPCCADFKEITYVLRWTGGPERTGTAILLLTFVDSAARLNPDRKPAQNALKLRASQILLFPFGGCDLSFSVTADGVCMGTTDVCNIASLLSSHGAGSFAACFGVMRQRKRLLKEV